MSTLNKELELGMKTKIEEAARTGKTWARHYWIYEDDEYVKIRRQVSC